MTLHPDVAQVPGEIANASLVGSLVRISQNPIAQQVVIELRLPEIPMRLTVDERRLVQQGDHYLWASVQKLVDSAERAILAVVEPGIVKRVDQVADSLRLEIEKLTAERDAAIDRAERAEQVVDRLLGRK